jgi:para-aminobenzoate synthetase component 1
LKRKFTSYPISDFYQFKTQILNFGKRFSNFCILDNQDYDFDKSFDCIAGFGVSQFITAGTNNNLSSVNDFLQENKDWIFGFASYDLKNEIEELSSQNQDGIGFPEFQFFVPEILLILSKDKVTVGILSNKNSKTVFEEIISLIPDDFIFPKPELQSRFSHYEYLETVKKLQQHILKGDCYEICFCQEFFAQNAQIDPVRVFKNLSLLSPNPFSAFYRSGEKYLLCASPERFLKKTNNTIISQPIKGTSRRTGNNINEDDEEKNRLQKNEKERAENIMIVDLVRNDLSKICTEGSVHVKEFFKIYSFPQVHQMISTIAGTLRENVSFAEILSATFPMGSMTGAPKKRAMEFIEQYEKTKRGLFSGTVGYITPERDFDFNVVIRSILYNESDKYLSIQAGSAITWKSIPEKEYEECNIKIEVLKKVLELKK